MIRSLVCFDDFFPAPEQVRAFALEHDFSGFTEVDGHRYPGMIAPKYDHFGLYCTALIQQAMGQAIEMMGVRFVLGTAMSFTEQWIHADALGCSHAAVCYLFDGHHQHGTALWRHREADSAELGPSFYEALGVDTADDEQVDTVVARLRREGQNDKAWEMAGFTEARFNRLIVYPCQSFHSRCPREAFGDSPENGRLVLVAFFTLL